MCFFGQNINFHPKKTTQKPQKKHSNNRKISHNVDKTNQLVEYINIKNTTNVYIKTNFCLAERKLQLTLSSEYSTITFYA